MYLEQSGSLRGDVVAWLLERSRAVDLAPGPGGSRMTPLPEVEVLGAGRYVLVALAPSSQLVAHRDPAIQGRRVHVPLRTNPGCWSYHGGVWQQLEVGHVYEMDPTVEHGAVNWGTETRLHLMVDA